MEGLRRRGLTQAPSVSRIMDRKPPTHRHTRIPPDDRFLLPAGSIFPRSFYQRPTLRVARDLLGKYFVRVDGKAVLAGRIVEVEAYLGSTDPASHAYRGRTKRNEVMFREGGFLYVYFTYGMHYCANVVTGREGSGSAVLIRALEPVAGITRMARYRKLDAHTRSPRMLTSGPARLCQALRIDGNQNGLDLQGPEMYIMKGPETVPPEIGSSPRVGISAGAEKPWRFFITGNPFVTRS